MTKRFVDYDFDRSLGFWNLLNKSPGVWFQNKKKADNAEGLWRIHDGLYDVTNFIQLHPGGKFWLEETKGMDVTEFFESHHVRSDKPEKMLKRFYVREAKGPRLSKYTFADNGFYRTLKRRVREVLKTIPEDRDDFSKFWCDVMVLTTFIFACSANYYSMYTLAFLAGFFSSLSLTATHNFIHQKDNWRMYYADVMLFPSRDARIFHAISHHMYTNTVADIQFIAGKPFIDHLPGPKSFIKKYLSWIYTPLLLWPILFYLTQLLSTLEYFVTKKRRGLEACLTFTVPFAMYIFGRQPLGTTLWMWQIIIVVYSFFFSIVALALNHAHPDIFVDGDLTRSEAEWDWGINQLDTSQDRTSANSYKLVVLLSFGDHGLHHLFPSLDHSILHDLYPVLEETLKEFNLNSIRMNTYSDLLMGYFKRMKMELPNLDPNSLGYIKK
ncbi:hypothetical protein RI129_010392 [Pyrocoelia pectoralis]|uniref:Cytochrome b5 heme-binding domain-containing protein n=1 Tax=Pyrocoelia pectoralis TaxID=417401 RepID=A0AAN7V4G8_9COLE